MEDIIVFTKPKEVHGYVYLNIMIMDGHNTQTKELEYHVTKLRTFLDTPYTDIQLQSFIHMLEEKWIYSGGYVLHIIQISYPKLFPTRVKIKRYQIGDCNSICINTKGICGDWMEQHNVKNMRERQRLLPWIYNQRVDGVLQCTRVVGNKKIKEKIVNKGAPKDSLAPTFSTETFIAEKKSNYLCIGGTDGCMQTYLDEPKLCNHIFSQWIKGCMVKDLMYQWLSRSSITDNNALVMIEMTSI